MKLPVLTFRISIFLLLIPGSFSVNATEPGKTSSAGSHRHWIPGSFSLTAAEPERREWTVESAIREALIAAPENADSQSVPLVFVFHGHGGTMKHAARTFRIHELWPEAITVYMQGLKTPGKLTDPDGTKPGWQSSQGDQMDRDLEFFDAVLTSLKQDYKVDEQRIYSTGHSNGGAFTYLLWAERHDVFAAMAPSGAAAIRFQQSLKPKPMLHVAGENDPLVKYVWQTNTIEYVKTLNECGEGSPWEKSCTLFPSKIDCPVVTFVTSQGHKFPPEAPPLIVRFFKEHARTEASRPR